MMNRRKKLSDDQIDALEAHLAGTLKPVIPPMDVVQRLHEQVRLWQPEVIVSRLRDWQRMFLVLGGVMSALMVTITVARALYYLVGRR
jgi:hypothetical protein